MQGDVEIKIDEITDAESVKIRIFDKFEIAQFKNNIETNLYVARVIVQDDAVLSESAWSINKNIYFTDKVIATNPVPFAEFRFEPEESLEAVKHDGMNLKFVQNKDYDMCHKAIEKNYKAIKYVEDQTEDLCMEAIKFNFHALKYIKDPTINMYVEGLKKNFATIIHIPDYAWNDCLDQILNDDDTIISFKAYMQNAKQLNASFETHIQNANQLNVLSINESLDKIPILTSETVKLYFTDLINDECVCEELEGPITLQFLINCVRKYVRLFFEKLSKYDLFDIDLDLDTKTNILNILITNTRSMIFIHELVNEIGIN